jgi:L-serine/L-threonine ammonia-lyase
LYSEGKRIFVCASSSNAGYATAFAARQLGAKAIIVAPEGSPEEALSAIRLLDAEVIVHGAVWYDANDLALDLVKKDPNKAYVSSYEDPVLWSGHATMIDELAEQCEKPTSSCVR